mgnify:CR=1 FL=1
MKKIGILGSTGSIGTQTLAVIRELNSREACGLRRFQPVMLTAGKNIRLLAEQAREFNVRVLAVASETDAVLLSEMLKDLQPLILTGEEGLCRAAAVQMDLLVTAIVGMAGLKPTLAAIEQGTDIALANKETLVAAGALVMQAAHEKNVRILPVDSEHSAIFQCLQGNRRDAVSELLLTASGGPFRGWSRAQMAEVTVEQALTHPTWKMGGKITVDSATLMNKGLEIIEAMHLFSMPENQISVVVHPQSIIHSMVMYRDGSVIGQMGNPDMKVPIQLALTYPERVASQTPRLNFAAIEQLTFEEPDEQAFPCLKIAREAARIGGSMTAVMNGANEAAVNCFMNQQIKFIEIPYIIESVMARHTPIAVPALSDIIRYDLWAREEVLRHVSAGRSEKVSPAKQIAR